MYICVKRKKVLGNRIKSPIANTLLYPSVFNFNPLFMNEV